MASLVRVMNVLARSAAREGHVERVELRAQIRRHRPTDDATAPGVNHDGEVETPGPHRNVRDIGNPELVTLFDREVPIDEIGRGTSVAITLRRTDPLAATHPHQGHRAHQASDALAPDTNFERRELGVHARCAVRPARPVMDRTDLVAQRGVGLSTSRHRATEPRVVPADGDPQRATERGDAMGGPVRSHELESLGGIEPLSRVNQAAAFLGSRAPRAGSSPRGGDSSALPAPRSSSHPVDGRDRGRPAEPSCGSTGPSARTSQQARPGYAPNERARSSFAGTPAGTAWALGHRGLLSPRKGSIVHETGATPDIRHQP